MNLIVAVDNNWAIGHKGDLLAKIPADLANFKKVTTGKVIIMGRKTLESLPNRKALPNRINIVITKQKGYQVDNATTVNSIQEALDLVSCYNEGDVFIIGGSEIYQQMLPMCTKAYITKVDHEYEADKYLTNLDKYDSWKCVEEEDFKYENLKYTFCKYERR